MARHSFRLLFCLVFVLAQQSVSACLWDRDTLASEAAGIPEVIRVITGRFERNPSLYYEMRLKRVAAELESKPEALELYDDAAVACDRLGRSEQALVWMEKKRQRLERLGLPESAARDHWYRYYANAGTFHAHKWVRSGANRTHLEDVKQARDLIAKAIEINPNAHFGREKYQLKAIDWLIEPPKVTDKDHQLPNLLTTEYRVTDAAEAVRGLTGLIVLGNAWESVDIFNALAKAIQSDEDRSSPARMARLRACELIDKGQKSLIPTAPTGEKLKKLVMGSDMRLDKDKKQEVDDVYARLRAEADKWHEQRTAYMMARLQTGKHPDTDPDFWRDYKETAPPEIKDTLLAKIRSYDLTVVVAFLAASGAVILFLSQRLLRTLVAKRKLRLSGGR